MMEDKVALVGGTGAIGKSVVAALRKQNLPYRVIGRSHDSLQRMSDGDPLAGIAIWDPDNPESIREAIRGVATAVYTVGVPYTDFHLHPVLMHRFLDASIAENLDRLLLIGILYVFGRAQSSRITESHPRSPHTFKGRMRKGQEDLVLEAHVSGKIKTTDGF